MVPNNNRFPGDVLIEILSRLPAESLMRFKCVHKSWYALLQDSKFVALHLRNYTWANNKSLYTLLLGSRENSFDTWKEVDVFLSMLKYDRVVALCAAKDADLSSICNRRVFQVCSPCDGIVCFGDYFDRVVIANPGIRQFRALPKSCIPHPTEDDIPVTMRHLFKNCDQKTIALGLGIDLETKGCKVVRISEILGFRDEPAPKYKRDLGVLRYDVEVYTIGSNSWRQIEDAYPFDCIFRCYWLSSYWKGAYYWCASKFLDGKHVGGICSFDFSEEVFKFITIPEYVFLLPHGGSLAEYGIIEFNGSLAVLCHHYMEIQSYFDIWVMDGFGAINTWKKILSGEPNISRSKQFATPLGFLEKYQLVLIINGQLSSYDFVTNQVKILPISGDNQLIYYYTGINYKTSLMSIVDNGYYVNG